MTAARSGPADGPARIPYSWTILRVVPWIERGEQINVGAALFCRSQDFLAVELAVDEDRLRAFAPGLDLVAVCTQLDGLVRVARGDADGGRLAGMSASDRFGFIAAPSSTIVQASPVHVGLSADPAAALSELVERYVRA